MSILHDAFQAIKDAIANAFNFAEPAAALQEAEHHFMNLVADEFQALLERVEKIEERLFPPSEQPAQAEQPAAEAPETQTEQPAQPADDATYNEFM